MISSTMTTVTITVRWVVCFLPPMWLSNGTPLDAIQRDLATARHWMWSSGTSRRHWITSIVTLDRDVCYWIMTLDGNVLWLEAWEQTVLSQQNKNSPTHVTAGHLWELFSFFEIFCVISYFIGSFNSAFWRSTWNHSSESYWCCILFISVSRSRKVGRLIQLHNRDKKTNIVTWLIFVKAVFFNAIMHFYLHYYCTM